MDEIISTCRRTAFGMEMGVKNRAMLSNGKTVPTRVLSKGKIKHHQRNATWSWTGRKHRMRDQRQSLR